MLLFYNMLGQSKTFLALHSPTMPNIQIVNFDHSKLSQLLFLSPQQSIQDYICNTWVQVELSIRILHSYYISWICLFFQPTTSSFMATNKEHCSLFCTNSKIPTRINWRHLAGKVLITLFKWNPWLQGSLRRGEGSGGGHDCINPSQEGPKVCTTKIQPSIYYDLWVVNSEAEREASLWSLILSLHSLAYLKREG